TAAHDYDLQVAHDGRCSTRSGPPRERALRLPQQRTRAACEAARTGTDACPEVEPVPSVAVAVRPHVWLDAIGLRGGRGSRPHAVVRPMLLAGDAVAFGAHRRPVRWVVPAGIVGSGLGHLLEALQVALHATVDHAERGADVLEEPFGVVLDVEVHSGRVRVELVERHLARVACAGYALPRDARVWLLCGDVSLPLLFLAADVRAPIEAVAALAAHLLHALHEGGKALELAEETVGLGHGHVDIYRFVEICHEGSPLGTDRRRGV